MRRRVLALTVATLAAGIALRAQEPAPDQSLERMRSVLAARPLRLTVPETEANFKIHIEAIHPMHDIFEKPPWQLDPIGWRPPRVGFDLLSAFRYVADMAADAKRERDVRLAREEVQRAIADYCAAQPNANTIQICPSSAAPR